MGVRDLVMRRLGFVLMETVAVLLRVVPMTGTPTTALLSSAVTPAGTLPAPPTSIWKVRVRLAPTPRARPVQTRVAVPLPASI